MKRLLTALICLFIYFGIFPVPTFATTSTTTPSIDTHVVKNTPNVSYPNATSITSFYDFPRQDAGIILLKFPIDSIPQNATLKKATLELYLTSVSGPNQIGLRISSIASNWDGQVTWNNKPGFSDAEGSQVSTQIDKNLGYKSFDITTIVQKWLSGSVNRGIAISDTTFDQVNYQNFASMENVTLNHRPKITFEYTTPLFIPIASNIINIPILNINPLTVSNVVVENITDTTATVKWKTNIDSTSWVIYGIATNGDLFNVIAGQNDSVKDHTVNLKNLYPDRKYSYKVMSKDANGNQTFGPISYFTTAQSGQIIPNATPTPVSSNPISNLQDNIENKVADAEINKAIEASGMLNETTGSADPSQSDLKSSGTIGGIAGLVGINKLAGILLIVLGLMSLIGIALLYFLGKKAHHHIRKRFDKNYEKGIKKGSK